MGNYHGTDIKDVKLVSLFYTLENDAQKFQTRS